MIQDGRSAAYIRLHVYTEGQIDLFVYKGAGLNRPFGRLRDKVWESKSKYELAVMCGGVCDLSHRDRCTKMYDDTPEETAAKSNLRIVEGIDMIKKEQQNNVTYNSASNK